MSNPNSSEQLSSDFKKLEITKPLDKKKDEYLKTIRSQKRKGLLRNKRLAAVNSLSTQLENTHLQEDTLGQGWPIQDFIVDCKERTYTLDQINELVYSLSSPSLYRQHFGVIGIRKLLTNETAPPIQLFIDAGAIPLLVELLPREDDHQLQYEAAWALSNLASGTAEQTQQLVDNGVIPELIKLLGSASKEVRTQAIWTLGNLSGDSVVCRNLVLQEGVVTLLVQILEEAISEKDMTTLQYGAWTMSNLCRGKPLPAYQVIKDALPILAKMVMSQKNLDVLIDALWCILHLADGGKQERIQRIIDTGVVPDIVRHMTNKNFSVMGVCIKIIGKISASNNEQVDVLLRTPEIMEKLLDALMCVKKSIRKEAIWVLSNIAAGTPDHIEEIIKKPEFLKQLFLIGSNDALDVRKEVAWVLTNALDSANKEQLRVLFEKGALEFFGNLIETVGLQEIGLEAIWKMLNLEVDRAPEGFTKADCWSLLKVNKILPVIEGLQESPNMRVCELAAKILEA